ncbi:MAG: hypothetical protein NTW65_02850 [Deltaproteobacteria bacterium]|nr:hypothetical protein [Deltaproteobacteria bacterium]
MKKFKIKGLYFIIISIFCVIINGCATTPSTPPGPIDPRMLPANEMVRLTINSFAAPDAKSKGKVYYITSAIQNVTDDDLEFQEIAGYLENSLIQDGLIRTNNRKEADILIRLGYGIGSPKTTSETYTTSTGYSYPVGWMWFNVPPKTQTVTNTSYMRNMVVEAYDLKDPNRKSQLWKTTVQSEGSMSDLRVILPYMIAGSMVEMGTNTGQQKTVNISGHHPNLFLIFKRASITANNYTGRKTVTFTNGDKYEGDFVNNKKTGRGTYTFANGNKYEGDWVNDKRNSRGTYTYANGDKYEGDFVDGKQQGKGIYTWADGRKYEGDWVSGNRTGKGTYAFANGAKYEGDWVNGKLHGKGTYTYANGDKYEGDFVDDKFTSRGKFTCSNGKQFTGNLENIVPKEFTTRCN